MSASNDRVAWLQGPSATCANLPEGFGHPWRLVLLGAPGVGKGTQAELLSAKLGSCHLSTGDVFRAAKAAAAAGKPITPAMTAAVECMRCGQLVPDKTVLEVVRERSTCMKCRGGFILDGYPRTVPQAEALAEDLKKARVKLDGVLNFTMPLEEIVARLSGRRTCGACKSVYHITGRPSKIEGVCDKCGGKLEQREDDRPESIRVRMAAYEHGTAPLAEYYKKQDLLLEIDSRGTPDEICGRAVALLAAKRKEAWK